VFCPECGEACDVSDICRTCKVCDACCECDVTGGDEFDSDEFGEDPEAEFERRFQT